MKKIDLTLLVVAFTGLLFFSGCNALKKMADRMNEVEYPVTPNPLEMHADSVAFTIDIVFPTKYFNKKVTFVGTPVLKYAGGETVLEPMTAIGESVEGNGTKINYENGGKVTLNSKIAYADAMRMSTLEWKNITGTTGKKEPQELPIPEDKKVLAKGIITTPELVEKGLIVDNDLYNTGAMFGKPAWVTEPLQITNTANYAADIHYLIQKYDIRSTEMKAEDIVNLVNNVTAANADPKKKFKNVEITSYASPDGPERLNEGLAANRTKAAEKWFMGELKKKAKIEDPTVGFAGNSVQEDWDGFKKLMEASTIQDKELILRVLSMYSDPEVREKEIKNISAAFTEIADKILPQLRRSMLKVNFEIVGKTPEEIAATGVSNPSELSGNELLYAGEANQSIDDKLKIYQHYASQNPNDWRGLNNVGVCYIYKNQMSKAKTTLESAANLEKNQVVLNNLGVVAMAMGDYDAAEKYFKEAAVKGGNESINYNLGVISIKKANYSQAVTYFGSTPTFNGSLAKLLNKDTGGASSTIKSVESKRKLAIVYYLMAVVGARTDDATMVLDNVKKAIDMDASLKAYAKNDMEFRNFFENTTFKTLIQ